MNERYLIISQEHLKSMPTDRPYTTLEAEYSYVFDTFKGTVKPTRYYMKLWGWSLNKTHRFIVEQKQNKSRTKVEQSDVINQPLEENNRTKVEQSQNKNRTVLINKNKRKNIYGKFNNVKLTLEQVESLKEKFNGQHVAWIEKLSEGKEMKGYKYTNDYLAILKWSKNPINKINKREDLWNE